MLVLRTGNILLKPISYLKSFIHNVHRRGSVNQPLLKTLPCQPGDFEVCQIKPSTMYFTQAKMAGLESAGHDRLVSVSQVCES